MIKKIYVAYCRQYSSEKLLESANLENLQEQIEYFKILLPYDFEIEEEYIEF